MNIIMAIIKWIMSWFQKETQNSDDQQDETIKKPEGLPTNTQVDTNDWYVKFQTSDPDHNCLRVVFREKYGQQLTVFCMVVFANNKTQQYKLIAPWMKGLEIERSNITTFDPVEVPKSEMNVSTYQ